MNTIERKTADMLTRDSVSILTQKFAEFDGEVRQVGKNHRCGYDNSVLGRQLLSDSEPAELVEEVMAVWGDTPTVEELKIDENHVPEPTQEERIAQLEKTVALQEEQLLASDESVILLYEMQTNQSAINDAQDEAITGLYEIMLS